MIFTKVKSWISRLKLSTSVLGLGAGLLLGAASMAGGMTVFSHHGTAEASEASLVQTADITPIHPPAGAPMSFAPIIERVSPAVVSIEIHGKMKVASGEVPNLPGFDFGNGNNKDNEREFAGAGSGFLISSDGYIVTNNHVVEHADEIKVTFSNEKKLKAVVVGRDPNTDLAVIKVEGNNFPFVSFELKNKPRVGDWVIAVGNPFGLSGTATAGIVSAFGRNDGSQGFVDYMQIDAPINHGNSGGPTFDLYGRVIGVNAAIITPSGASAGIGFAIPADIAYNITQKLIKGGKVDRGYIGVQISSVSEDEAEALGTKDLNGAYISNVTKGGPADKAGIQAGDIVRAVNGEAVKTSADLTKKVAQFKPGDKMVLSIYRGGKLVQITVTSGLRPSEDKLALGDSSSDDDTGVTGSGPKANASDKAPALGLSVKPVTPDVRKSLHMSDEVSGLVVTGLEDSSDAAQKGLSRGDVIIMADQRPVKSREELNKILEELNKAGRPSILLLVNHDGRNVPLPVKLKP